MSITTTTRGHQFKIYKRFNSCSVWSHFFCERVVNIWNRLPMDSTDFGSLHRFRNSLDAVDDICWCTMIVIVLGLREYYILVSFL